MTTPPDPPLDAAEDDPDATEAASLPGYSAGDRTTPEEPVGPPAQEPVGPPAQDG